MSGPRQGLSASCRYEAAHCRGLAEAGHTVSQPLPMSLTVACGVCRAVTPPRGVEGPPLARPSSADGHWAVCAFRLPWPTPSFWAVGDMSAFASGHRPRRDRQGHGAVARSACWAAACCGPRPARCVDRKPASRLTPTRPRLLSPAGSVQPRSKVPSWCRLWVAGHMPVSGSVLSFWVKVSECIPEKRRTPTRTGRDHAGSRLVVPRAEGTQEAG